MQKIWGVCLVLMCVGCASAERYNACGVPLPPENADAEIVKMFNDCRFKNGYAGDKNRRYYTAFFKGKNAETNARRAAAKNVRRDVTGGRDNSKIPLNDFERMKHYRDGEKYWGIYFLPTSEYRSLKKQYGKKK